MSRASLKRPLCPHCQKPLQRCHCRFVVDCENQLPVVIWQHPTESTHPKGTAPLLVDCLQRVHILAEERLSPEQMQQQTGIARPLLLFPAPETASPAQPTQADPVISATHDGLLVLDGTWRKARKLCYLNPWLLNLVKLDLGHYQGPRRYTIRKPERRGQLSTFEATILALKHLQPELPAFDQAMASFERYMLWMTPHKQNT